MNNPFSPPHRNISRVRIPHMFLFQIKQTLAYLTNRKTGTGKIVNQVFRQGQKCKIEQKDKKERPRAILEK